MKCEEAQEWFGVYFDLPEADFRRLSVEKHIGGCPSCREEFEFWQESNDLIRMAAMDDPVELEMPAPISSQVMSRIYQDEGWRMPVQNRIYSIPFKLRRNLTAFIAFCLSLFILSFIYHLAGSSSVDVSQAAQLGVKQVAHASVSPSDSLNVRLMVHPAVASLSPAIMDPVKIGPLRSGPDYWLSVSILGLIGSLLIMNWFTRTKS